MGESNSGESSAFNAANIVVKAGLGLLPGGGVITAGFELLQLAGKTVAEHIEARNERRYSEFIQNLLAGTADADCGLHLDVDDFHALLNACLADLENQKAELYGALTRSIGTNKVPVELRRVLMLYLKDLSFDQLEKLRRVYVATTHYLKGPEVGPWGTRKQANSFLSGLAPIDAIDRDALVSRMLVTEEGQKLTNVGATLVRSCYACSQLMPSSIGEIGMKTGYLQVIASDMEDRRSRDIVEAIRVEAWDNDIVAGGGVETIDFQKPSDGGDPCYVLIADEEEADGAHDKLRQFAAQHLDGRAIVLFLGTPTPDLLNSLKDPILLFDDGDCAARDVAKAVLGRVLDIWE